MIVWQHQEEISFVHRSIPLFGSIAAVYNGEHPLKETINSFKSRLEGLKSIINIFL